MSKEIDLGPADGRFDNYYSAALEALNEIREKNCDCDAFQRRCDIIEAALKENQERIEELEETNNLMAMREHKNTKKIKVLELLKKNLVIAFEEDNGIDLPTLVVGIKTDKNKLCIIYSTQDKEEFNLLKEVLL